MTDKCYVLDASTVLAAFFDEPGAEVVAERMMSPSWSTRRFTAIWPKKMVPATREGGYGRKTVMMETGKLAIEVPRDRQVSFDPQFIAKYQRRFPGFDDKIVSMYARGMSTREIVGHLHELYGIDVSPGLISMVKDAVLDEVSGFGTTLGRTDDYWDTCS